MSAAWLCKTYFNVSGKKNAFFIENRWNEILTSDLNWLNS